MNLKVELPESTWQQITNMLDNYLSLGEGQPDRDLGNPATDLKKAIDKAKHVVLNRYASAGRMISSLIAITDDGLRAWAYQAAFFFA